MEIGPAYAGDVSEGALPFVVKRMTLFDVDVVAVTVNVSKYVPLSLFSTGAEAENPYVPTVMALGIMPFLNARARTVVGLLTVTLVRR
jgi:hypothetical protein